MVINRMLAKVHVRALGLLLLLLPLGQLAAVPVIQHWQTGNGARVFFVPAPQLPMVDIRVVFDAGSARDGTQFGLAQFTNALLEEGAGELDATAIAASFEGVGAEFSASVRRDMAVVNLRSLTDPELLTTAVDTLALVLREPSFPNRAVERVRKQIQVGLQAQEQRPGEIAKKAFYQNLFATHPYAHPTLGTAETIAAISGEDLRRFYAQHYVGRNAVVAIVGAVDRTQAEALAEQVIGSLPAGEAAPPLPGVAPLTQAKQQHIVHPSTQTHIQMGQPGMRRGDPDYFALYVGNHVLGGGGFISRIMDEVRDKRGLSYSAYSYFLPLREDGPFLLGLQTENGKAEEARTVLHDTLATFVAEGPTEKELAESKKNITGGFPLRIDSNKDIVEYLAMIGFYGLPLDYLNRFNERVEAVTVDTVRDAFKRRVDPERLVTVTVGGEA